MEGERETVHLTLDSHYQNDSAFSKVGNGSNQFHSFSPKYDSAIHVLGCLADRLVVVIDVLVIR